MSRATSDVRAFDAVEVLTQASEERDELLALLGDPSSDLDAHLVSDVLRSTGRVGDTLATRRVLVELCAVLRAIDAAVRERIALDELRAGIELHAARTDRFAAFRDVRVLLRTLDEVLEPGRIQHDERATRAQVELLHRDLQAWMEDELVGDAPSRTDHDAPVPAVTAVEDPRAPFEVRDPVERRHAHDLVEELLHGARHHPVTGLLGAAWMRDWSAVPVAGERFGEDPGDIDRLADAFAGELPGVTHVLQVERRAPSRWRLDGSTIIVGDGLRRSWKLPTSRDGLTLAALEDRSRAVLVPTTLDMALVEGVDHHALLGPAAFVEAAAGMPPLHAIARFREHVESLAEDGEDPPEHLVELATSFGRLRRRSR